MILRNRMSPIVELFYCGRNCFAEVARHLSEFLEYQKLRLFDDCAARASQAKTFWLHPCPICSCIQGHRSPVPFSGPPDRSHSRPVGLY